MTPLNWKAMALKAASNPKVRRAVLAILASVFLMIYIPLASLPSAIFEASDAASKSADQTMQTESVQEKKSLLSRIFAGRNDPDSIWSFFSNLFSKKDFDDEPLLIGSEEMNIYGSEEDLQATLASKVEKTEKRVKKKIAEIESEIKNDDYPAKEEGILTGQFPEGFPSGYKGYDEYVVECAIDGYTSDMVDEYDAVKLIALYTVMMPSENRNESIGAYLDWLGKPGSWKGTYLNQEDQLSYDADKAAGTLNESNYEKTALLNTYIKWDPSTTTFDCEQLKSRKVKTKSIDPETGEEVIATETITRCKVTVRYIIESIGYYELSDEVKLWSGPLTEEKAEELNLDLTWTSPGGQHVERNFPSQLEYYQYLIQATGTFMGYDSVFFADGDNYIGNIALQAGLNPDYAWPLDTSAGQKYKITSRVGHRGWATAGSPEYHAGTDIGAAVGTKVYSATDGEVVYVVRQDKSARGVYIGIKDRSGLVNIYQHLLEGSIPSTMTPGTIVKQGDYIGMVGKTGFITGPHLHWEIRQNNMQGKIVDAMQFFGYAKVI